jgi:hypothetical protein
MEYPATPRISAVQMAATIAGEGSVGEELTEFTLPLFRQVNLTCFEGRMIYIVPCERSGPCRSLGQVGLWVGSEGGHRAGCAAAFSTIPLDKISRLGDVVI